MTHETGTRTDTHPGKAGEKGLRLNILAVSVVCGVVSLGSAGAYALFGHHLDPAPITLSSDVAAPSSAREGVSEDTSPEKLSDNIERMVERLALKLVINPDDVEGWRVLGWSYYNMERYQEAAEAYGRAASLRSNSAILMSLQGEALVKSAGGQVTAAASEIFERALALDPRDVRAGYFSGLALYQAGDTKSALAAWTALLKHGSKDAQWVRDLRKQIAIIAGASGAGTQTAHEANGPVEPLLVQSGQAKAGPTAEDLKSAEQMSPEERLAMARGMVDRLAARLKTAPNDPDGWIRLIRSRLVLQERDAAHAALTQAMKVFAGETQTRERIKKAALGMGLAAE